MKTFEEFHFRVKHSNIKVSPKTFDELEDGDFFYVYALGVGRTYCTKAVFSGWNEKGFLRWYTVKGYTSLDVNTNKRKMTGKTIYKNDIFIYTTNIDDMRNSLRDENLEVYFCDYEKHSNYKIEE